MKRFYITATILVGLSQLCFAGDPAFDHSMVLANQLYGSRNFEGALQNYLVALQIDPNSSAAFQGQGNCLYLLNRRPEALQAYEKALSLDPQNSAVAQTISFLKKKMTPVNQVTPVVEAPVTNPQTGPDPNLVPTDQGPHKGHQEPIEDLKSSWNPVIVHFQGGEAVGTGDQFKKGYGGGLGIEVPLDLHLTFGGGFFYYAFSTTGAYGSGGSPGDVTLYEDSGEATLDLAYHLGHSALRPYFEVGSGVSYLSTSAQPANQNPGNPFQGSVPTLSSLQALAFLGAGVDFAFDEKLGIFFQTRYVAVFSDPGSTS